ncbi:hypothetical protein DL96DRAFT_1610650 [Flagelloscypha sp. PMI_526]|nr:hypothetical protein DL96DRAFT_1610650 [Flagelloscypha sp. PMI_526]
MVSSNHLAARRGKRSQQVVAPKVTSFSTNVASYDRQDPFLAVNTLMKLLTSLPYRGYKLSSEEHALSLYLLSIIEPFIGSTPSERRTILTRQPTEILDTIVFHVEDKPDLLALGLSCRRLHDVIFPRHFDYRIVRAKPSSLRVWHYLRTHPILARHVRILEVLDERAVVGEVLPPGIQNTDTDLDSTDDELTPGGLQAKHERCLISALEEMSSLRSFTWSCNHSPNGIDGVWQTLLRRCEGLKEIRVHDNLIFAGPAETGLEGANQSSSLLFPCVRSVSFSSTKHSYGTAKLPDLACIRSMLEACPNIEALNINYLAPRSQTARPSANELLLFGRWPATLPPGGYAALSSFLIAHSNIQTLHLDFRSMGIGPPLLGPNTLPHLRELKASRDLATVILSSPCDVVRPLETIKGLNLTGDPSFLTQLRRHQSTLRKVELSSWHEMEEVRHLVGTLPLLTVLDLGKRLATTQSRPSTSALPTTNALEWATLLSPLTHLTAFHGVKFFYEISNAVLSVPIERLTTADRSRVKKNEEVASVLAWKCPKLRRVDHWEELYQQGSGKRDKVVVLIREKEGVRWEVRRVKS